MMKHLNCIGKYTSPWLGYVKSTQENCGLNSVWISHVQSGSGVSSEGVKKNIARSVSAEMVEQNLNRGRFFLI